MNQLRNSRSSNSSVEFSVLKMISKELRIHAWQLKPADSAVTEALLRFVIHVYRESQLVHVRDSFDKDDEKSETVEREFMFSLAHKLGVRSLAIFSEIWQEFLTCEQLQQLVVMVAPAAAEPEVGGAAESLSPELIKIIEEFYDCRLFHVEDSCLMLTKYLKPNDTEYSKIVGMILDNSEHYHSEALFHLAQLMASKRRCRRDLMDSDIFAVITKAFDNLSGTSAPGKMLDQVDWMFAMCTGNRRDPARSPFYAKMINLLCRPGDGTHREVLLRVLQRMESQPSLMKHPTAAQLGLTLVSGYRKYFTGRFHVCGHAAYAGIIAEMQRARLECRHYVKNGEVVFDNEVVDLIRRSHGTKKKLMKLLSVDFPEPAKTVSP